MSNVEQKKRRFTEIGKIMNDISEGIAFIHQNKNIHRDLKPQNGNKRLWQDWLWVLYSSKCDVWKIADFGLTTEGTRRAQTTAFSRGTDGYRAPELLHEQSTYSNKVDIWAIGCIFFELIFFRRAFSNDFAVLRHGLKEMQLEIPLNTVKEIFPEDISSDSAIGLLDSMFEIDPANRPSAQVILSKLPAIFDVKIDFQSIDQSTVDISTRFNDMTLSQSAEEPIEVGALCILVSDYSGIPRGCTVWGWDQIRAETWYFLQAGSQRRNHFDRWRGQP